MPGYIQLPNEFYSFLPLLTGAELKVLLSILRKTIGYHKVSAIVSLSEISKISGIDRRNLPRIIQSLSKKINLTKLSQEGSFCYSISFTNEAKKPYFDCYSKYSAKNSLCSFQRTSQVQLICSTCPRYLLSQK